MYKYYKEVFSNEHMLFLNEIAEVYGIFSSTGKPHSLLIKRIIVDFINENNILYSGLFFNTKKGLREVYPNAIYSNAIKRFYRLIDNNQYKALDNKKYKFTLKGEDVICHT